MQLDLLDGLMSDQSGLCRAPVSRSRSRAKAKAQTIHGTYGPTVIESFVEDGPLSSWESRLRERLATIGSMEYALTWRRKDTKRGLSISRLHPSTRRINETDCTGSRRKRNAPTADLSDSLTSAASAVMLAGYPTPRTSDTNGAGEHGQGGLDLRTVAQMISGYPTPTTRDWKDGAIGLTLGNLVTLGLTGTSLDPTETASTGALNPAFTPLAPRLPGHVGQLRAYGNAICAPLAAEVIRAWMEG